VDRGSYHCHQRKRVAAHPYLLSLANQFSVTKLYVMLDGGLKAGKQSFTLFYYVIHLFREPSWTILDLLVAQRPCVDQERHKQSRLLSRNLVPREALADYNRSLDARLSI